MHSFTPTEGLTKPEAYRELGHQLSSLLADESDGLAMPPTSQHCSFKRCRE
jgi:hypothetical protein